MDYMNRPHKLNQPRAMIRHWTMVVSSIVFLTTGCSADVSVRGNTVNQEKLTQIKPGIQDRGGVQKLLGSPTNVATFNGETWYYISQKERSTAFAKPKPLTRKVIAISFNSAGRVAKVKKYTLADGRVIEPTKRNTPTPGQEFSLIRQLIGNLGRFEHTNSGGDRF